MPKEENNLELWEAVCTTDPKYTKHVDMRGGFTAIDPQYQMRMATEQWGPYGTTWGLTEMQWAFSNEREGERPSLILHALFWYPPDGKFPIAVDMAWKPNDDCYKKLATAARSKALSLLGFNADIFLGQFDDERYVAMVRAKFSDQEELRKTMLGKIRSADTTKALEACRSRVDELFANGAVNKTMRDEAYQVIAGRAKELDNPAAAKCDSEGKLIN